MNVRVTATEVPAPGRRPSQSSHRWPEGSGISPLSSLRLCEAPPSGVAVLFLAHSQQLKIHKRLFARKYQSG